MIRSVPVASTVLASSPASSCILLLARPALRPDACGRHARPCLGLQLVRARPPTAQSWGTQLEMERAFFSPAAKGRPQGITSSPSLRVTYLPEQNPRDTRVPITTIAHTIFSTAINYPHPVPHRLPAGLPGTWFFSNHYPLSKLALAHVPDHDGPGLLPCPRRRPRPLFRPLSLLSVPIRQRWSRV